MNRPHAIRRHSVAAHLAAMAVLGALVLTGAFIIRKLHDSAAPDCLQLACGAPPVFGAPPGP